MCLRRFAETSAFIDKRRSLRLPGVGGHARSSCRRDGASPAIGILPSGLRPDPGGAPLSRCGRLASSVATRPDSGLRSGLTMARRSLAASIQARRQDPIPSRFCSCKAEIPLQWVARNQIASDSLVRCRRVLAATEA